MIVDAIITVLALLFVSCIALTAIFGDTFLKSCKSLRERWKQEKRIVEERHKAEQREKTAREEAEREMKGD